MSTAKPTLLDCEHTVWFKPEWTPSPGDPVFCSKCQTYRLVPQIDPVLGTYYPEGDWFCYRVTKTTCRGVCNACGHERVGPFKALRTHMEKHARRRCAIEVVIETATLPPNSPPPF